MRGLLAAGLVAISALTGSAFAQNADSAAESTTDHSKLKPLMREFVSGPEVTSVCLSCHTEADNQVMHTLHFTWDFTHPQTGQTLGKRSRRQQNPL